MILYPFEPGRLKLLGDHLSRIGDYVLVELVTLIGLCEVHVTDFLDSLEVQLALLKVALASGCAQEELHDDEEAND